MTDIPLNTTFYPLHTTVYIIRYCFQQQRPTRSVRHNKYVNSSVVVGR